MHSDKQLNDETIEKLFHGIDVEESGQIHYNEFLAAVVESQGLITMEHLADAFDRLDGDEKGYLCKDDLKDILGTDYNEEKVNRMIDEADSDKNGQIDYDEFLRLMFEDPASGLDVLGNNIVSASDHEMLEKLVPIEPSREIPDINKLER
jgi:calcium-dependent protein kinase